MLGRGQWGREVSPPPSLFSRGLACLLIPHTLRTFLFHPWSLIFHCSCSESKIVACFSNHSSSFWIFQENLTPWDTEVPAQGFVRPCELSGVQSSH